MAEDKKTKRDMSIEDFGDLAEFNGLRIKLASPKEIQDWSHGEVTEPETINYRTWRPEKNGLFCEKIFGPTKNYQCYCGKYKKRRYKGVVCDKCGVEVTHSRVRRERMGHITLAAPIVHLWYWKNTFSPLAYLLNISRKDLEGVIYFARYMVLATDGRVQRGAPAKIEDGVEAKKEAISKQVEDKMKKLQESKKKEEARLEKEIKDSDQLAIAKEELTVKFRQKKQRLKNKEAVEHDKLDELKKDLVDKAESIDVLSVLTESELHHLREFGADDFFEVEVGAEAILKVLKDISLTSTIRDLRQQLQETRSKQKKKKLMRRIRVINGMIKADIEPSWMILRSLPVIPPELRPMVQLTGGRFATSDLNDLYRRVINRNNRLKRLMELGAPEIILRNEKRMLQESVDMLIDATKSRRQRYSKRPPRSLSDLLKGKKGRFRRNLLGKRVDYSGRSVIVSGPKLKLNQCGLPREMALELFRPFILREMILRGLAPNVRSAKNLLDHKPPEVYDILEEVVKNKVVLLNRAPTLHKLSIQAFKPTLVDGLAIRIPACICSGFNADFDGDEMGVHLPLSKKAQKEAMEKMMPGNNLLKPASGRPINVPTKEMVVGCYFITSLRQEDKELFEDKEKALKEVHLFADEDEAMMAWRQRKIELRELIGVKLGKELIVTTIGRLLFNQLIPDDMDFINEPVESGQIKNLINTAYKNYDSEVVVDLIDGLKDLGFYGATYSGISPSIFDCKLLPDKDKIIKDANQKASQIEENYREGLITRNERDELTQNMWIETTENIADLTWDRFESDDPVKMISDAGISRVSRDQIKQVSGMRGLVVDPMGRIVPLPTKSNFREGLSVFEYVTGARGSRKGLTDTALKTADAGYLTRRLVDVAHSSLIREEDCGTTRKLVIKNSGERQKSFAKRILGRHLADKVVDPETEKTLFKKGHFVSEEDAQLIADKEVKEVAVRSPLYCRTKYGVCSTCYGWDMSNKKAVAIGTPVGVVAAQSIGEPGTQLTMRTKHAGGVVGKDVTQGLPRVEELLEVRTPKNLAPIAEIDGKIKFSETEQGYQISLVGGKGKKKKSVSYRVPLTSTLMVKNGEVVEKGTQLASGSMDIEQVLEVCGLRDAQLLLLKEVQRVYESQGITIHDKHFETLIREMSSRVKVTRPGDSDFLIGEYVEQPIYQEVNQELKDEKKKPAKGKRVILGLIKAALNTYSWLSAASFQHTTNVLTEASILGKVDPMIGLKENVIVGRKIPITPERAKLE
jgi:DNA-directed RNA polymerase subunit beta'